MAVRDANRDAGMCGASQNQTAEVVQVGVNHVIGAVLFDHTAELRRIAPRTAGFGRLDEPRSGGLDSLIQGSGAVCMGQYIVLKAGAVGARQQIHKPGFGSTAVHGADHMQDAGGAFPRAGAGSHQRTDFDRRYHWRTPERSRINRKGRIEYQHTLRTRSAVSARAYRVAVRSSVAPSARIAGSLRPRTASESLPAIHPMTSNTNGTPAQPKFSYASAQKERGAQPQNRGIASAADGFRKPARDPSDDEQHQRNAGPTEVFIRFRDE